MYVCMYVRIFILDFLDGSLQSAHHSWKETLHLRQLSVAELRSNRDEAYCEHEEASRQM